MPKECQCAAGNEARGTHHTQDQVGNNKQKRMKMNSGYDEVNIDMNVNINIT